MTHDACMRRHAILLLLLQTCGKLLKENFWKKRTLIIRLEMWHYSAVAWMKAPPVTCKPQGGRVEPWLCEWVLCEAKGCCLLLLSASVCSCLLLLSAAVCSLVLSIHRFTVHWPHNVVSVMYLQCTSCEGMVESLFCIIQQYLYNIPLKDSTPSIYSFHHSFHWLYIRSEPWLHSPRHQLQGICVIPSAKPQSYLWPTVGRIAPRNEEERV